VHLLCAQSLCARTLCTCIHVYHECHWSPGGARLAGCLRQQVKSLAVAKNGCKCHSSNFQAFNEVQLNLPTSILHNLLVYQLNFGCCVIAQISQAGPAWGLRLHSSAHKEPKPADEMTICRYSFYLSFLCFLPPAFFSFTKSPSSWFSTRGKTFTVIDSCRWIIWGNIASVSAQRTRVEKWVALANNPPRFYEAACLLFPLFGLLVALRCSRHASHPRFSIANIAFIPLASSKSPLRYRNDFVEKALTLKLWLNNEMHNFWK